MLGHSKLDFSFPSTARVSYKKPRDLSIIDLVFSLFAIYKINNTNVITFSLRFSVLPSFRVIFSSYLKSLRF